MRKRADPVILGRRGLSDIFNILNPFSINYAWGLACPYCNYWSNSGMVAYTYALDTWSQTTTKTQITISKIISLWVYNLSSIIIIQKLQYTVIIVGQGDLVQQNLLYLAQRGFWYQAQQSLPNWPTNYKFAKLPTTETT